MIRRIIFAWFIVLGVTAASAYGQSSGLSNNRSSISGYIFGPDRRPLSQVWVELRADVGAGSSRVRTDGSGRYYFPGLPNGRYQLRVLPFGTNLEEKTEDVELAGVGVRGQPIPQNEQRDIYLANAKALRLRSQIRSYSLRTSPRMPRRSSNPPRMTSATATATSQRPNSSARSRYFPNISPLFYASVRSASPKRIILRPSRFSGELGR